MFFLIGFIFLLFKIAIYSSLYAAITLYIIAWWRKRSDPNKTINRKFLRWWAIASVYGICFFLYSFSYWGYKGLGDYACIPISNGYVVSAIDNFSYGYIEVEDGQTSMEAFIIRDGKLYGETTVDNSDWCGNCYLIFDPGVNTKIELMAKEDYTELAVKNNYPNPALFKSFWENYREHWGGIRVFLPLQSYSPVLNFSSLPNRKVEIGPAAT